MQGSADKYVTFSDFIIQYHKIPHCDLSMINKIEFTMKKRSLVHQICFNVHTHLLKNLLNIQEDSCTPKIAAQRPETSPDESRKVKERPSNSFGNMG